MIFSINMNKFNFEIRYLSFNKQTGDINEDSKNKEDTLCHCE